MPLPDLLSVSEVQERLRVIFPQGTPNRNYVTREIAAKTVFVLLYIGAIDGAERWLRPESSHPHDGCAGGISESRIMLHCGTNVRQVRLSDLMRS